MATRRVSELLGWLGSFLCGYAGAWELANLGMWLF